MVAPSGVMCTDLSYLHYKFALFCWLASRCSVMAVVSSSCLLEVSPIVVADNGKFDASMENKVTYDAAKSDSSVQQLTSDAVIEVSIEILFPFQAIPKQAIESTGTQVLEQILGIMLSQFMSQDWPVVGCCHFSLTELKYKSQMISMLLWH